MTSAYEPWNEARGAEIIAEHDKLEGATLVILHALQEAFGYVPEPAIPMIAAALACHAPRCMACSRSTTISDTNPPDPCAQATTSLPTHLLCSLLRRRPDQLDGGRDRGADRDRGRRDDRAGVGVTLLVIAGGVVLAAPVPAESEGDPRRTALLAGHRRAVLRRRPLRDRAGERRTAARVGAVPARVLGVAAVTLPLVVTRRLVLTRAAVPFVVASGLCEVGGFACYALGSRHGIAVAAVLASQFAAVAAVAAYFLFHERLTRLQLAGVIAIPAGVAALTALQAVSPPLQVARTNGIERDRHHACVATARGSREGMICRRRGRGNRCSRRRVGGVDRGLATYRADAPHRSRSGARRRSSCATTRPCSSRSPRRRSSSRSRPRRRRSSARPPAASRSRTSWTSSRRTRPASRSRPPSRGGGWPGVPSGHCAPRPAATRGSRSSVAASASPPRP